MDMIRTILRTSIHNTSVVVKVGVLQNVTTPHFTQSDQMSGKGGKPVK